MIWVAWRQLRASTLTACAVLVAIMIVLALTGPSLEHLYDWYTNHAVTCGMGGGTGCAALDVEFENRFSPFRTILNLLGPIVLAAPALIGMFWGAPLVAHELEAGTLRLAWTQSVTRQRWLAGKLVFAGSITVVVMMGLGLATTWWAGPIDRMNQNRFALVGFDERGVTPAGYGLLALAIGVTVGLTIRRTFAAMGITLLMFVGSHGLISKFVRPHLIPPVHSVVPLTLHAGPTIFTSGTGTYIRAAVNRPGAWIYSTRVVDSTGTAPSTNAIRQACPNLSPSNDCITRLAYRFHVETVFQPASRYWELQFAEAGFCIAIALVLVGLSLWLVRRSI